MKKRILVVVSRLYIGGAEKVAMDIKLKDLAQQIARYVRRSVIFELPDAVESAGYSKATVANNG